MTSDERIMKADRTLSCYRKLKSILESSENLGDYANVDLDAVKADLFELHRSVTSLYPSSERLLLIQHYINGNTFEVCAELLGISRRSVFRLRKRALELYFNKRIGEGKDGSDLCPSARSTAVFNG